MREPKIESHGPVATHDEVCAACLRRPAVYDMGETRMQPCWECQREGWRLMRLSRFWKWVLA